MQDRVAFTLGARFTYNRVLWQMLQGSTRLAGFDVMFPIFGLPMHSGTGFMLIHLWEEYWRYGKARHGGIHSFAQDCRRFVRVNYEQS